MPKYLLTLRKRVIPPVIDYDTTRYYTRSIEQREVIGCRDLIIKEALRELQVLGGSFILQPLT